MAKKIVVWTATAVYQRRAIFKFWTLRNGSTIYAEKLIKLIAKQIKIIQNHQESFKNSEFPDTRESALGHFSIYYKITSEKLIITAFWDNRQDPKSLFKLLESKNQF